MSKTEKEYLINGDNYFPNTQASRTACLPPGAYECGITLEGAPYLSPVTITTDKIIDIPNSFTSDIISEIKEFWSTGVSAKFEQYGLVHKRGVILAGRPGCHAAGTEVLMFDGSIKKVEDIAVGELLMGPDSKSRTVLELCSGNEEMVEIIPTKGDKFICNINHILSLRKTGTDIIVNIKVSDFLKQSKRFQGRHKLYRTGVEFQSDETLEIPSYILGMWLGDGSSRGTQLTSMDKELVNEWKNYAKLIAMQVRTEENTPNNKAKNYFITSGNKQKNPFKAKLRKLNLYLNKHIPHKYLTASREDRLNLLAGLLDTDGHLSDGGFEIITKYPKLNKDILFLARSLGFAAYSSVKTIKNVDYDRIYISGDCSIIPTKLSRKFAKPRKQIKNVNNTGFTVKKLKSDNYYGFCLNSDHLYLLSDFTVTHNTGKSITLAKAAQVVINEFQGIVLFNPSPDNLDAFLRLIKEIEPTKKVLIMWEEFDSILSYSESKLLSLLDGEIQVGNIMYLATTNYLAKIPARIKNRPSRFARVIEVTEPDETARRAFLQAKLVGDDTQHLEAMVQATEGFVIDQLKDIIISVCCFGYPIAEAVLKIKEMEEDSMGIDDYNEEQAQGVFQSNKNQNGKRAKPLQPLR